MVTNQTGLEYVSVLPCSRAHHCRHHSPVYRHISGLLWYIYCYRRTFVDFHLYNPAL